MMHIYGGMVMNPHQMKLLAKAVVFCPVIENLKGVQAIMKTHTFKKGDRVKSLLHQDAIGVLIAKPDEGWLMLRDDGYARANKPYWWVRDEHLVHDRDLKVGDWVRYEGVNDHKSEHYEGKTGQIKGIDKWSAYVSGFTFPRPMLENLVKIAPPEEEKMSEKVTIEHDQWGRVENCQISKQEFPQWVCRDNGRISYFNGFDGWREVKPKRWVLHNIDIGFRDLFLCDEKGTRFDLPPGFRWKKVEIEREAEG